MKRITYLVILFSAINFLCSCQREDIEYINFPENKEFIYAVLEENILTGNVEYYYKTFIINKLYINDNGLYFLELVRGSSFSDTIDAKICYIDFNNNSIYLDNLKKKVILIKKPYDIGNNWEDDEYLSKIKAKYKYYHNNKLFDVIVVEMIPKKDINEKYIIHYCHNIGPIKIIQFIDDHKLTHIYIGNKQAGLEEGVRP